MAGITFGSLKRQFGEWLDENDILSTAKSISSYKSYVSKLQRDYGAEKFDAVVSAYEGKNKEQIREVYFQIIDFIEGKKKSNKKTWTNIGSGFHQFDFFLRDLYDFAGTESEQKKEIKEKNYPKIKVDVIKEEKVVKPTKISGKSKKFFEEFSQKELYRIFKGRLKTQSRYYPADVDLLFPVRLITAIFHKKKDKSFDEWMMSGLQEMIVLGENDAYHFGDVKKIRFLKGEENDENNRVMVVLNNSKEFELYTYKGDAQTKIPLSTLYVGDISIDHMISLAEEMAKRKDSLPAFRKITDMYHQFEKDFPEKLNPRAERTWKKALLENYSNELCSDRMRESIMKDLNRLNLKYILMDQRENSSKGKK